MADEKKLTAEAVEEVKENAQPVGEEKKKRGRKKKEEKTEAPKAEEKVEKPTKPAYSSTWPEKIGEFLDESKKSRRLETPLEQYGRELKAMQRAIKNRSVLRARVTGVRPVKVGDDMMMECMCGMLPVFIGIEDFHAYSNMKDMEKDSKEAQLVRYRQKGARVVTGAIVSFMPLELGKKENGAPFVVGSRALAMEALQKRFFFGEKPVKRGDIAVATVMAAGPTYLTAECLGIETIMARGSLSAFEYITNVSDKYKPGDELYVMIEKLEIDKDNLAIDIRFSHSLYERMTVPVPLVDEGMKGGRYGATVVSFEKESDYVVVCLDEGGIRGLVPKNYAKAPQDNPIKNGDRVVMMITNIDTERNVVIGYCLKANA